MEPSSPSHKRAAILMFFLFLWAALVAARLFYFTVFAQDEYLAAGERISQRVGRIPSTRGRIMSSTGAVLAWSEMRTDLIVNTVPESSFRRSFLERRVGKFIPGFSFDSMESEMAIKKDLPPRELIRLYPLVLRYLEFEFFRRVIRRHAPGEDEGLIGDTVEEDGRLVGISGYEKRYDRRLRGLDGEFRVMVDKTGRWIPGTWRETVKPRNGHDVVVRE